MNNRCCFLFVCLLVLVKFNLAGFVCGRQDLINIGQRTISSISRDYRQAHDIPLANTRGGSHDGG